MTGDPAPDLPRLTADDLREPLVDLTTLACRGVPGCDAASVTVRLGEGFETTAASNEAAREMDRVQYDHGDGPCVRSLLRGEVVAVEDYRTEARWPRSRAAALAHGVGSSLSLPLCDGARVLGALNLYADAHAAFGDPSHHVADVLVRAAATVAGSSSSRPRPLRTTLTARSRPARDGRRRKRRSVPGPPTRRAGRAGRRRSPRARRRP